MLTQALTTHCVSVKELRAMAKQTLQEKTLDFSVNIIKNCKNLNVDHALSSQLLRSATSIGANVREAHYGSSTADFINKLQIAQKECYETEYWLELFYKSEIITEDLFLSLLGECKKIRAMLSSSILKTKENN